jgi:two-component system response regulator DesR
MSPTVVLAEPHAIARQGLTAVLESDPELRVVAADDREGALAASALHHASVLVISHRLLRHGGGDLRPIGPLPPQTRAIVLGLEVHPGFGRRATEAGADGYVIKDRADRDLVPLVHALLAATTS